MRALRLCTLGLLLSWSWACDDGGGGQSGDAARDMASTAGDAAADTVEAAADAPPDVPALPADARDVAIAADAPDVPPTTVSKVDIVFVVDNSGSMQQEQANLARNFPGFMQELANLQIADVRIAVVNTDLGAGAMTANPQCAPTTPGGDRGLFCHVRGMDFCQRCGVDTSQGRFLRTVPINFPGGLPQVFTCVAMIGFGGCSFQQPLGALTKALVQAENGSFLRADAYLAFVIITDGDDCSVPPDSALFAQPIANQDWSLRCALEGHVCAGSHPTGTQPVDFALAECRTASDGALVPVPQLVDAVARIKDPRLIIATGIFGWPLPGAEATARYRITAGGAAPGSYGQLPICESASVGSATVGYRVKTFVESFPNHGTYSICQDDFREAMRLIGEKIRTTVGP
jgi:hypothetical protein